ncbi:MAG: ribosome small subunit-dependent GTPase A [Candidatus Eremiobacteraeota bacterium]|nr:ribosome small subunit-dependent GTPase A [Candidatus Eremiobacteraeota bacterium]
MKELSRKQLQGIKHYFREKELRRKAQEAKMHHRSPSGDGRRRESLARIISEKVEHIVIVSSFILPPLKTGLIDRFLVMSALEGIEPIIVLNKTDLLPHRADGEKTLSLYRSLGYYGLLASTVTCEGIDLLRDMLRGRSSMLAGHSGVGKSSLLNAMEPGITDRPLVREVSSSTMKGTHTTTSVILYRFPDGTAIFDLPGLKLAPLHGVAPAEIGRCFPEFGYFVRRCRFNDCIHREEPECGVREALEEGAISKDRYESYLRMLGEITDRILF